MNTRAIGRRGEDLAVGYLVEHKYKIVDRNYQCYFGEIDLVALDGRTYVFIEVKMRSDTKFGWPRESVNRSKQLTIIKCAKSWLYQKKHYGANVRFDVIEVIGEDVIHLIDAFRP